MTTKETWNMKSLSNLYLPFGSKPVLYMCYQVMGQVKWGFNVIPLYSLYTLEQNGVSPGSTHTSTQDYMNCKITTV